MNIKLANKKNKWTKNKFVSLIRGVEITRYGKRDYKWRWGEANRVTLKLITLGVMTMALNDNYTNTKWNNITSILKI